MTNIQKNLIAGEWLAGTGEIENHNPPSDLSDLVASLPRPAATSWTRRWTRPASHSVNGPPTGWSASRPC